MIGHIDETNGEFLHFPCCQYMAQGKDYVPFVSGDVSGYSASNNAIATLTGAASPDGYLYEGIWKVGIGDYLLLKNSAGANWDALNNKNRVTIFLALYPTSAPAATWFLFGQSDGTNANQIRVLMSATTISVRVDAGGTASGVAWTYGSDIVLNTWNYIPIIYDGTLTNVDRIQINHGLSTSTIVRKTAPINVGTTVPTSLATVSGQPTWVAGGVSQTSVVGHVGFVGVWSRALGLTELNTIRSYGIFQNGLLATGTGVTSALAVPATTTPIAITPKTGGYAKQVTFAGQFNITQTDAVKRVYGASLPAAWFTAASTRDKVVVTNASGTELPCYCTYLDKANQECEILVWVDTTAGTDLDVIVWANQTPTVAPKWSSYYGLNAVAYYPFKEASGSINEVVGNREHTQSGTTGVTMYTKDDAYPVRGVKFDGLASGGGRFVYGSPTLPQSGDVSIMVNARTGLPTGTGYLYIEQSGSRLYQNVTPRWAITRDNAGTTTLELTARQRTGMMQRYLLTAPSGSGSNWYNHGVVVTSVANTLPITTGTNTTIGATSAGATQFFGIALELMFFVGLLTATAHKNISDSQLLAPMGFDKKSGGAEIAGNIASHQHFESLKNINSLCSLT